MISGMGFEVVLWDFGDTLVDERWMQRPPDSFPSWPTAWANVMTDRADDWNIGRVEMSQIFIELANRTGMTTEDVAAHALDCCHRLVFNPTAWQIASERRFTQAIVTVNPDLFAKYVMPAYELAAIFDVIVMSFAERTTDKPTLCNIALGRLGFKGDIAHCLLIDNRLDFVQAWQNVGGVSYWFQGDEQFKRDVPLLFG
jgi:hypothetical protein